MKQTILSILAVLLLFSCSKHEDPAVVGPRANELLTFSAQPSLTRATFSGDDGTLAWSYYDNLGAYSFSGGTLLHSGWCSIDSYSSSEAVFKSSDTRATWAGSTGGTVTFYAYYPQVTAPIAPCSDGKLSLSVPVSQTEEFGKSQLCLARTEVTAEDLTNGEDVVFQFSPVTSMLRIKPYLSDESTVDELSIKQLRVTVSGVKIAGDCRLTLSDGSLALSGEGSNTINITLSSLMRITKDKDESGSIPVVILPVDGTSQTVSFTLITSDGKSFPLPDKLATNFKAGTRYNLERAASVVLTADETPDAMYTDGGYAWDHEDTVEDGAYTDGGYAW